MAYTTIDKPSDYFNTKLYTGNGASSHAISGVGFQPDWTWNKNRSSAVNHALTDSVRGAPLRLMSQSNDEEINQTTGLLSFNSDGFTVGSDTGYNGNGNSMVSWNWKAGTSFTNDASSTGIGSIDSAGSFNNDSGFSIVSYTGTGSNGTIKHGLNSVPSMIIVKERDNANDWKVYHHSIGNGKSLRLDTTAAQGDDSTAWNSTTPTSSVFSVGTSNAVNRNGGGIIAYLFAEKQGYSKFGSYVGNGNADGTFVYTGQKSAFVMIKRTDTAKNWLILDNKRNTDDNPYNTELVANDSRTEETNIRFDSLSNGFKLRLASGASNVSGGNYIYMAFAENPFVTSTGVPATAR